MGTCIGKLTKSNKFRIQITGLDYVNHYTKHKVWVKPNKEISILYGNHVIKRDIMKMTENAEAKAGVVILSAIDDPIAFGVINKSSIDTRAVDSENICVFNQGDIGLYIRQEKELFGLTKPNEEYEIKE